MVDLQEIPRSTHLLAVADTRDARERSTVRLFENGVPIGPAHSLHDDIRVSGSGRFSHWGSTLYFSSTDNSDPNKNNRTYSLHW